LLQIDDKAERLRLEARVDAERLRQEKKAEAERVRLAEERHLQQMQLEWHTNHAAADSARQQDQFESQHLSGSELGRRLKRLRKKNNSPGKVTKMLVTA